MQQPLIEQALQSSENIPLAPVSEWKVAFGINSSSNNTLSLTLSSVVIKNQTTLLVELPFSDLIGFHEEVINDPLVKITLNSFPKRKKFMRSTGRYLQKTSFYIFASKVQEIQTLKIALLKGITGRKHETSQDRLKLMIYFNPNAGSNSKKHLKAVLDFLAETNLKFDLLETERKGHCQEHLDTLSVEQYHGVVIISGDGLVHEFANSKAASLIPLTHVPAGSANAMAKTQMEQAGQNCHAEQSIFLALKGKVHKHNLIKFEIEGTEQPIFGFLSLEWAIIADVDLNSEFLRFLGGLRFTLYTVFRMIALRRYPGTLSYSVDSTKLPAMTQEIEDNLSFKTIEATFLHTMFCMLPYIAEDCRIAPMQNPEKDFIDFQMVTEENGKWQLLKYLINMGDGSQFNTKEGAPKEGYVFGYEMIKSFRLTATGEDKGQFMIDGENYKGTKIQGAIADAKMMVFG